MKWFSVKEAARYVRKTDTYIYQHVYAGHIPAYRPRDQERPRIVIAQDDLDDWIRREWELVKGNTL